MNRGKENNMNNSVNSDTSVERTENSFKKRLYISPSLTEIGKINHTTKGKNVVGPDAGNWLES